MGKEFQRERGKPNFSSRGMRGGNRGGRGGRGGVGGMRPKAKAIIEPHRFPGIFIAKTQRDESLVTFSFAPGEVVYGEKKIQIEDVAHKNPDQPAPKLEYRVWNSFRSKLAACIVNGVKSIYIAPGSKVLYLGAASGTTVSHVSDIVGDQGVVYAVEISERCGRDLTNMAKKRPNVIPIIEDGRKPWRYRMMLSMCDVIFSDVAQPDQARIIALNAQYFLKNDGGFVFSIKANCIDSTASPAVIFKSQIQELKANGFKCKEQVTLEPFERDHCVVTGLYRPYDKNQNK